MKTASTNHGIPAPQGQPGEIRWLPLDRLEPDPEQPRQTFREQRYKNLAASVRRYGVLQALLVRPLAGGRYRIVAGERRYQAARLAGLSEVPCVVRDCSPEEGLRLALVENLHRDGLSDIDKCEALHRLRALTGLDWPALAPLVQLSAIRVRQIASLNTLHPRVKEAARAGRISGRVALALKPLPPVEQASLLQAAIAEKLTAEAVRARVAAWRGSDAGRCMTRNTPDRRNGPSAPAQPLVEQLRGVAAALEQSAAALTAEERDQLRERLRELLTLLEAPEECCEAGTPRPALQAA
jgi:ParB family transcriptional regulator, chromosome partitioning protein